MGLFGWLNKKIARSDTELVGAVDQAMRFMKPLAEEFSQLFEPAAPNGDCGFSMPVYQGKMICDWSDEVNRLKRDGHLDEALVIARGCMDAMVDAALSDPSIVMEYYVIEVAKIQHKQKAFADEAQIINNWLRLGFPAPRHDYRVNLHKRLAKAKELWAKSEGRPYESYRAQWQELVEEEKALKAQGHEGSSVSSGYSLVHVSSPHPVRSHRNTPSNKVSRYVPTGPELVQDPFIAVDFETANRTSGVSACQIALVRVEAGKIVNRYATLIKPPPQYYHFEFTYLHGISPQDVEFAPTWVDIVGVVTEFVGGLPVYAHNAKFDASVWAELDEFYHTSSLPESFYCSYRTAERLLPGLENYKLPTVVHACAPSYCLDHHRADSDAEACALIVKHLQKIVQEG